MTIEEMEKIRKEKGLTYQQISEESGVALGTVQKIFGKTTTSPRYDTVQKLTDLFVRESNAYHADGSATDGRVKIRRIKTDRQGTYTIDDYYDWPDDERVELIDGVIYDMAAPTQSHQVVQYEIYTQVSAQIRKRGGGCVPLGAPSDVELGDDRRTMVQPDFMIVCDRSKLDGQRCVGAPDFVIEILSPSSRKKDAFIKHNKYMTSGVREYWTVDLRDKLVTVYCCDEGRVFQYSVEEKVPIGIYDGAIAVDFGEIMEYVRDIFGEEFEE